MELTKKNCRVKIKAGEEFNTYKAVIDGYSVNGISILHPNAINLDNEETFDFLTEFLKKNKDWRKDAQIGTTTIEGKDKHYIIFATEMEDTDF